jgi:DNA primase
VTLYKTDTKYKNNELRIELDILKAAVDSENLIKSLGFKVSRDTPKEIRCVCKIHGGDNETAFRLNKENNTWSCFTNKCHEVYGRDVLGLIMGTLQVDFKSAVKYLKDFIGDIDKSKSMYIIRNKRKEQEQFIRCFGSEHEKPWYVDDERLKNIFMLKRSDYFLQKGFSKNTLEFFEVGGGWQEEDGSIRDIIPIRDEDGVLVAYSRRALTDNIGMDDKYKLTTGFDKDACLYNLNNSKHYLDRLPLIVVEGFKSVWRLHEYGIKNVAAAIGSHVTPGQQMLLMTYAINGVVIFFDNDIAGIKGASLAFNELKDKLDIKPIFIHDMDENGKGLDPADLSKNQVYNYLKTYF